MLLLEMIQFIFRSVKMHDLAMDQKRVSDPVVEVLTAGPHGEPQGTSGARGSSEIASGKPQGERDTTLALRHDYRCSSCELVPRCFPNSQPTQKLVLHSQSAITSDPGKLLDEVKKTRKPTTKVVDDASANANLSPAAITVLQKFTREFLDCFNGRSILWC